jgi:predicted lipoprotein
MARALIEETKALHAAVVPWAEDPRDDRHRRAQRALQSTLLAWKRAYAFRAGPVAASNAFSHAAFWPAKPASIEAILVSGSPIDEGRVEQLGVDTRGLFALEYLLFSGAPLPSSRVDRSSSERVRAYARELSSHLLGYAARIAKLVGDGNAYAATFAAGGRSAVDEIVAQSLDTLDMVQGKFARVARASADRLPMEFAVEGFFSGASLDIAHALVGGVERLYCGGAGGGLTNLVAQVSLPIDEHIREAFADFSARVKSLGLPLERALELSPAGFRAATASVENLRHIFKVEVASALEA